MSKVKDSIKGEFSNILQNMLPNQFTVEPKKKKRGDIIAIEGNNNSMLTQLGDLSEQVKKVIAEKMLEVLGKQQVEEKTQTMMKQEEVKKHRDVEMEQEAEKQQDVEMEREAEKQKDVEMEREAEKQRDVEMEREAEKQRDVEMEREAEKQRDVEMEQEMERQEMEWQQMSQEWEYFSGRNNSVCSVHTWLGCFTTHLLSIAASLQVVMTVIQLKSTKLLTPGMLNYMV